MAQCYLESTTSCLPILRDICWGYIQTHWWDSSCFILTRAENNQSPQQKKDNLELCHEWAELPSPDTQLPFLRIGAQISKLEMTSIHSLLSNAGKSLGASSYAPCLQPRKGCKIGAKSLLPRHDAVSYLFHCISCTSKWGSHSFVRSCQTLLPSLHL